MVNLIAVTAVLLTSRLYRC